MVERYSSTVSGFNAYLMPQVHILLAVIGDAQFLSTSLLTKGHRVGVEGYDHIEADHPSLQR